MDTSLLFTEDYVKAATDTQLSSTESSLLITLLQQEDRYDFGQLLDLALPSPILELLQQLSVLLHLPPSTVWMATVLLKKLILEQHSLSLLTVVACMTLALKYEDASQSFDYERLAQCCRIDSAHLIHDAEMDLLDSLSYDIAVTTPDHFFSYLSNLTCDSKDLIEQARSLLLQLLISSPPETFGMLQHYPCSIVALSLLCTIGTDAFVLSQVKSFVERKKDPSHYMHQLLHCTTQLRKALAH